MSISEQYDEVIEDLKFKIDEASDEKDKKFYQQQYVKLVELRDKYFTSNLEAEMTEKKEKNSMVKTIITSAGAVIVALCPIITSIIDNSGENKRQEACLKQEKEIMQAKLSLMRDISKNEYEGTYLCTGTMDRKILNSTFKE